eukprot:2079075-Amphidinium_carterae.1
MDKLDEQLWKQLEERDGKLSDNEDYIKAWDTRDEATMKIVCYNYTSRLMDNSDKLRHEWRKIQIEKDIKTNEILWQKAQQKEEERQQAEKWKRDQEAQKAAMTGTTAKAKPTTAPELQPAAASSSSSDIIYGAKETNKASATTEISKDMNLKTV